MRESRPQSGGLTETAVKLGEFGIRPEIWLRRYAFVFSDIDLKSRTVLDIGSGVGWASYYAAANGAEKVVSIEPEAAGSRSAMLERANAIRSKLRLESRVKIVPLRLEDAEINEKFDVVLLHNSINHFDEEACARLYLDDKEAWQRYRFLAVRIAQLTRPGGVLIVCDCARRNLFGDLGIKNPLARTINWTIHQSPKLWAKLFHEAGFVSQDIRWTPIPQLGAVAPLLTAPPVAYALTSHFRLAMRRA